MTISLDIIKSLRAPFPLKAHSIRQGHSTKDGAKCIWFVYLDRIAIIDRLDELVPGQWEYAMSPVEDRGTHYSCVGTLTICGISRSFNGTQEKRTNKKGDYVSLDNDEKGVGTDTFRRTASMWGIGAYLHESPDLWTQKPSSYSDKVPEAEAKKEFAAWYRMQHDNKAEPPPLPAPPQKQIDNGKKPELTEAEYAVRSDLHTKINDVFPDYHPLLTLKAMGADSLDNFGNLSNAAVQIKEHCYSTLSPVKVHYMRYIVTERAKYLEFINDPEPKLQHGLIRGYGRSTRIKAMLDGINLDLYHQLDMERYDNTKNHEEKGATPWVKLAQPLVLSYSEGNGYYTVEAIELPDEDIEFAS
jgi:hypothetical protein